MENTPSYTPSASLDHTLPGDKKSLAMASLIVGISSLCMAPFFIITLLAWPASVVAIILGILGIKSTRKGMSIAGLVLGNIALIALIGMYVYNKIHGQEILISLGY